MIEAVAIVENSDIKRAVREAVRKIGLPRVKNKRVLIKPNCNSPDKFPATTNPEVVVQIIKLLKEAKAKEIIVGDKSSIEHWLLGTKRIMSLIGLWEAVQREKVKIFSFDDEGWIRVKPKGASHWRWGFKIPKILKEVDVIISAPVIHTHRLTGISLSLKNSVGVLSAWDRRTMHFTRHLQEKIAEINLAYEVDLVVMDGTKAFISGGPHQGEMVEPKTIVVSKSRVQADIAAYKLLVDWGADLPLPPESHPQIAQAMKIGVK